MELVVDSVNLCFLTIKKFFVRTFKLLYGLGVTFYDDELILSIEQKSKLVEIKYKIKKVSYRERIFIRFILWDIIYGNKSEQVISGKLFICQVNDVPAKKEIYQLYCLLK